MNNQADFSTGKIFPMILHFSIPAAASLLITAIYNIVDRIFIGNFNGNTALAALSICFPLSFMMIAFGLMCSAGGSTLFTLYRGKDDTKNANLSFSSAFLLTIFFELFLTIVLLVFSDFFLHLFGVTKTTYDLALQYYNIVSLGCLFQGLTFVFCDFVRVSGKPVLGMCVTGLGAVSNIILDAVFVAGFHWGVKGAALATVIGQILSTLFGAYLLFGGKTLVVIKKDTFRIGKEVSAKLLNCGFAFWIAQMAMGFIALVYNGQLGKYGGDVAISAYAVVASIMTFIIMPASGVSQGIQPLVGYNYSCGNGERVKKVFLQATELSVGFTVVIWLITEIFPEFIIKMFGGNNELLGIGVPALRFNFIIAPVLGFVMLATTFFQSIGKPKASSIITLIRQVLALVPFIYIFPVFFGTMGIFCAQPVSDFIATVLSVILIRKEFSILPQTEKETLDVNEQSNPSKKGLVLTIGREHGSGGRLIGKAVAKKLNIPCYDKEIVYLISKKYGYAPDFVQNLEQMPSDAFFYGLSSGILGESVTKDNMKVQDKIFEAQYQTIRKIAGSGSCVIVGRCADYILQNSGIPCLNAFIHAPIEDRRKRAIETYNIPENKADSVIQQTDNNRAKHYKQYCKRIWGSSKNYHITLDSRRLGIDGCTNLLVQIMKHFMGA